MMPGGMPFYYEHTHARERNEGREREGVCVIEREWEGEREGERE